MTGLQMEFMAYGGYTDVFRDMLNQTREVGSHIRLCPFISYNMPPPEKAVAVLSKTLSKFREDFKSNPNIMRVGNRPVIFIYNPKAYTPEQWRTVFDGLDKNFEVPFVYLVNYRSLGFAKGGLEKNLYKFLPVFDGVSNYGSSGLSDQRACAKILERVMKKDFPQKIYDGGVHAGQTMHYHMGGLEVDLSRQYRESFDIYLKTEPDGITVTNIFDHQECSHIFPSYEREDFMMRYLQYRVSKWRGEPFPARKTPELVVTNHIQILLGRQDLDFEVLGFPIDSKKKDVTIRLEMCDTTGKVLHTFPEKKMVLDDFRAERFSVPSADFAGERGVVPHLTYIWNSKTYKMNYGPMTQISPSIRTYRMYWARSTGNELLTRGKDSWTLNETGPGGTVIPDNSGLAIFTGDKKPVWNAGRRGGYLRHGIKRNGHEFHFTKNPVSHMKMRLSLPTPKPGPALHWYYLEMENSEGCKWQSLPIWETDGSRAKKVSVPIRLKDRTVRDFMIEGARVPFFHYPCHRDTHQLLLDVSGYQHNGRICGGGKTAWNGGSLSSLGYNYYHNGPVGSGNYSIFHRDPDGRGFLRFTGKDYISLMGSTAFPGASTYELSVRPAELGKTMGLLGSANNQISLRIRPDGTLQASRSSEKEGMGGSSPKRRFNNTLISKTKLQAGQWTRIALVYDCRKLKLYVNGNLEGEIKSAPIPGHDWINFLLIGASVKWVWNPVEWFRGDIRNIRIYGRNLSPEEFLPDDGAGKKNERTRK